MSTIGGFLELEITKKISMVHKNVSKYNLARNALIDYLLSEKASKVWLPSYCCSSISVALKKKSIDYCFYNVNEKLEIESKIVLGSNDCLLYVNYFGIKNKYVESLIKRYESQLIIDNSQAFYAVFDHAKASIYSLRKFFGVPDGAYLRPAISGKENYESNEAMFDTTHLVGRIEKGPELYYKEYKKSEKKLSESGIRPMSRFTEKLINAIDHDQVKEARINNYNYLQKELGDINAIEPDLTLKLGKWSDGEVPLVYPYLHQKGEELKKELIKNKVFVASYWLEVLNNNHSSKFEKFFTKNMVPLPIDQRYTKIEMDIIANIVKEFNNGKNLGSGY